MASRQCSNSTLALEDLRPPTKRTKSCSAAKALRCSAESVEFDGLEIDIPGRSVSVDGKKIDLTPKEYDLLFYLVRNKNIALSRDKLLQDVWGYDFFGDDRTIDTHIKNLRNNLGPYREMIVTLRGVGYKFETK